MKELQEDLIFLCRHFSKKNIRFIKIIIPILSLTPRPSTYVINSSSILKLSFRLYYICSILRLSYLMLYLNNGFIDHLLVLCMNLCLTYCFKSLINNQSSCPHEPINPFYIAYYRDNTFGSQTPLRNEFNSRTQVHN